MTSASQLLYSGAYYSGSKPQLLQMLIMCCVSVFVCKNNAVLWRRNLLMKTILWAFVYYFFSVLSFAVWQIRPQTGQSIHQTLKRKFLYCRYNFNLLLWFGKSNIWHLWMLPGQHLLWMWICVWVLYVSLVDFVLCLFVPPIFLSPVLPLLPPHHARHAPTAPTLGTLQLAARSLPAQG